jgi:hypothetical protein
MLCSDFYSIADHSMPGHAHHSMPDFWMGGQANDVEKSHLYCDYDSLFATFSATGPSFTSFVLFLTPLGTYGQATFEAPSFERLFTFQGRGPPHAYQLG